MYKYILLCTLCILTIPSAAAFEYYSDSAGNQQWVMYTLFPQPIYDIWDSISDDIDQYPTYYQTVVTFGQTALQNPAVDILRGQATGIESVFATNNIRRLYGELTPLCVRVQDVPQVSVEIYAAIEGNNIVLKAAPSPYCS